MNTTTLGSSQQLLSDFFRSTSSKSNLKCITWLSRKILNQEAGLYVSLIIGFVLLFTYGQAQTPIINLKYNTTMKKVAFNSEGLNLVGNLYYPTNFEKGKKYPAIVVNGTWTSVKEQMESLYAEQLAAQGFIALAFDFRNYGESEGQPRYYESPQMKKVDIKNAVTYLTSLEEVDTNRIASIGICAGAMYTLMAAVEDPRIKTVAVAAPWLHDVEAVKWFYGGEEGVQTKIKAAQAAKEKFPNSQGYNP